MPSQLDCGERVGHIGHVEHVARYRINAIYLMARYGVMIRYYSSLLFSTFERALDMGRKNCVMLRAGSLGSQLAYTLSAR